MLKFKDGLLNNVTTGINPQPNRQDNIDSGDQKNEGCNDPSSEPSTHGLDLDSFLESEILPKTTSE